MSYYEKWYAAVVELLVASGLVTREEIASSKPAKGSAKSVPMLKPAEAAMLPFRLPQVMLKTVAPRYAIGQRVRARKMNPIGHTRLPRYARGRTGVVEGIAASRLFRILMSTGGARIRSTFTQFASRRASCGVRKRPRAMPSISTCGRITLSLSDLAAFPALPRDEGEPVFAEPWEAQAFALAVRLSALGHFTWKEWTAVLAEEFKAASERGEPDDGTCYYHYWLVALERLVTAKGLSDSAELLARKEAWADAYRHTPHGKPVELAAAGHTTGKVVLVKFCKFGQ